jgi:hypothetical protein
MIMTLRQLLNERLGASIHCLVTGNQVRTLALSGDYVDLRSGDGNEVAILADEPLVYEAWCMDRGSILVKSCDDGMIKLCTEGDRIVLEDGVETTVAWDDHTQRLWRAS